MPTDVALRPCLGCGTPTRGARCDSCEGLRPRRAKLYDHRWRQLSRAARSAQPWCSECGATTDLTADHLVPLAAGGELHPSVMQVLCRTCNSRKGRGQGSIRDKRPPAPPHATSESESFAP